VADRDQQETGRVTNINLMSGTAVTIVTSNATYVTAYPSSFRVVFSTLDPFQRITWPA